MSKSNSFSHLTLEERRIILTGIMNGSTKTAIAQTIGKDKSTVDKEIKLRRTLTHKCKMPLECNNYRKYLQGRTYKDYREYISENPDIFIAQMDTVYNDETNEPFIQTFKFVNAGILFGIYHETKTAQSMKERVDFLEAILGTNKIYKNPVSFATVDLSVTLNSSFV